MAKVSLIIPVYRCREHIVDCLDSVLAQTLDDIEAILVDDHGKDDSIQLARERLSRYDGPKRFVFTETTANSGPGAARNLGIRQASGDYLAFLDADDSINPVFCQSLYEAAIRADADIAFGSIAFCSLEETIVRHNPAVRDGAFESAVKKAYLRKFTSYFTTYLYKKSLLVDGGIVFPRTHSAEDSCFLTCCLLSARRIASDNRACYNYRIHPASTSHKRDPLRWKNRLESFRKVEAFAREQGLYAPYRGVIRLLVAKKGWGMALKDYLTNNLFIKPYGKTD